MREKKKLKKGAGEKKRILVLCCFKHRGNMEDLGTTNTSNSLKPF